MSVLAVVPTVSPDRAKASADWLEAAEVEYLLVCNGASCAEAAKDGGLSFVDFGDNPGFARSIVRAVGLAGSWDWLLLLNDDLQPSEGVPEEVITALRQRDASAPHLVLFDPEPLRPIPSTATVFMDVSLVGNALGRLALAKRPRGAANSWYKSFSAVAISRLAWEELGGLDVSYPFCYEDADFTARYSRRFGVAAEEVPLSIGHSKSGTTRSHISAVLPVVTWSARVYLTRRGASARKADFVLGSALVLRLFMAPFARSNLNKHILGIMRSLSVLRSRHEPTLPDYESL